jgi:hypothetical protein
MRITTQLGAGAFMLFLIFSGAVSQRLDSDFDGATDRVVFVQRMNEDDPNQSFMAVGNENRVFQIVSDTSSCTNVLNYVSGDRAFLSLLSDRGFQFVACISERGSKVDVEQREIVTVQTKPTLPKPSRRDWRSVVSI